MEYYLKTPISEDEIRKLKVGDVIYITGEMITARDAAHKMALEYFEKGLEIPVEFRDKVLYHCGPVVKKKDGEWEIVAAGPTTSTRMEYIEWRFIETFKPRVILGKGGMGDKTLEALNKVGAVYALFPGGVAVVAAESVKRVKAVYWLEELSIPEALWVLEVEKFGPAVVTMDSHMNSLHKDVEAETKKKLDDILKKI
ncbi:fumarate hydratase [Candidatus Geothermarchaeota archaeon]|nr:MAG: fumarate hydratase [Candidatus Geothermarchaeota archaeon]